MQKRINLGLLNGFLVISFGILCFFIVKLDIQNFIDGGGTPETFRFWYVSILYLEKDVNFVISCIATIVLFGVAIKYNKIRVRLTDKYLANMILCSMLYLGISRVLEAYYIMSESDLYYFIYVVTKFYFPLDILSVVFLSIVAISGFLLPAESDSKRFNRLNQFLLFLAIGGFLIGILIILFPLTDMLFKIIVTVLGILLFLFMLILISITCYNIFHSWSRMQPFRAMGFQLILSMLAILLLIVSEVGGALPITNQVLYIFKDIKNGSFLIIGILYYFSIIKPSKEAQL